MSSLIAESKIMRNALQIFYFFNIVLPSAKNVLWLRQVDLIDLDWPFGLDETDADMETKGIKNKRKQKFDGRSLFVMVGAHNSLVKQAP